MDEAKKEPTGGVSGGRMCQVNSHRSGESPVPVPDATEASFQSNVLVYDSRNEYEAEA